MQPSFQTAAVLFQKESTDAMALANDALRLGISGRTGDPLLSYPVLCGRKPLLGQNLDQSGVKVYHKQREGGVVVRRGPIAGRNDQLLCPRKLGWHADFERACRQVQGHLELGNRRCMRIDAVARLLEPARKFSDIESLERIGIK